nr:hypothetical protein [Kofleriaceae bacterium]
MGNAPEDDVSGDAIPSPAGNPGSDLSTRASAMAARIDAMSFEEDEDKARAAEADAAAAAAAPAPVAAPAAAVPEAIPSANDSKPIEATPIEATPIEANARTRLDTEAPIDIDDIEELSESAAIPLRPTPNPMTPGSGPVVAIPPPTAIPPPRAVAIPRMPPPLPPAIPSRTTTGAVVIVPPKPPTMPLAKIPLVTRQASRTIPPDGGVVERDRRTTPPPSIAIPSPSHARSDLHAPPPSPPAPPPSSASLEALADAGLAVPSPASSGQLPAAGSDPEVAVRRAGKTQPPPPPTPDDARARRPSEGGRARPGTGAPHDEDSGVHPNPDDSLEVGTATPNIVADQPLEARLESPTVLERALAELGDAGIERRAEAMTRELDAATDPAHAAMLAYELGELCERRLADEARAVKAFGRALTLDSSLRPNLWAIRRVFYRRALWPNLAKLIDAEVAYARDDRERADLLLEKSRVVAAAGDPDEARSALDEAARISPNHQGVLLALERAVARANDVPALLDVWERLAETVELPARRIGYWLEVGRHAAPTQYARAQAAFDFAALASQQLATGGAAAGERIARERVRASEEHGAPADVLAALELLVASLLAGFGPAGVGPVDGPASPDRADAATGGAEWSMTPRANLLRHEMVALRRRQAQLARGGAGTSEQAWDYLQQALALAPGEPLVLADLTELAEELGRYDDLAELVQSWQAVEGDPARALVLSIRRADALLRGGQRDQARALLASLEATAPGFIVLTSAAERDAIGRADAADLARTYATAAQAALLGTWLGPGQPPAPDPGAAAALYVQAAELFAYDVRRGEAEGAATGALDEARALLGKAIEAVPSYVPALEALTELDDATGQVAPALARLRAAAATVPADAKRAVIERAIRLARSHGDLDSALELERDLALLAPDDTALKWRLEATLAQLAKDDERGALLESIARIETDATRRGTALLAAARLRERAGAVESSIELYRQVLALWPEDSFARESLLDLLRAQERWAELVTERRAEARALPDGAAARRALREATWVLEIRLGDLASAAVVYDEWLGRAPDDRTALEGLARTRAALDDRLGEVSARSRLADLDDTAESRWLLGRALERAAHFDEAADVYRHILTAGAPSIAATAAALALSDLAASRADSVMRVEATAALSSRTVDTRLGAALAEDSGWMYALVLEDFDRAAQSFEVAVVLEPTRRGALLGGALVAARRGDATGLAKAYEGLAGAVGSSGQATSASAETAAALHLRAAAMALAAGDVELANARVLAARTAAPDDSSALLVVAETGASAPADDGGGGSSPDAGSKAVDALLARAEVLEMRGALADDPAARASWELDRAEALEVAGRLREAGKVVAAVLQAHPGDLRALAALRRMTKRAGDDRTWARASYALAKVIGDRVAKLTCLRDAASVFDRPHGAPEGDAELAVSTYRRILAVDPAAPEHDRLLAILRERRDVPGLTAAITDRLVFLDNERRGDVAAVPLLLERATILHALGDQPAAMADLDALLDRAPDNGEALRFRADLAIHAGDAPGAVALWRRYLGVETRPDRRAEIELQLAGVLAENVNDLAGAIEQLARVVAATPDDLALHERMLGLCLRASDWPRAVSSLEALARLRTTPADKAREELRLGLMQRDKLGDRAAARRTLERARGLDPLNLDVVRDLLDLLEPAPRAKMLGEAAASLRSSIAAAPGKAPLYERLAQVTAWQSDIDARWLALVAVEALATPTVDQRQVLAQGRAKQTAASRGKLDDASRGKLRGPAVSAGAPLAELWRQIAPSVQAATGVDPGKLGFARGDKIAIKKLGDRYEPLAGALAAFGLDDVDIYVGASRPGFARALAGDTPMLLVGADVAAAATPAHRFQLARAVASVADGVATIGELRDGELEWTVAAALRAAEAQVPGELAEMVAARGDDKSAAERAKQLKLPRKARNTLQQLATGKGAAALAAIAPFRAAALAVGQRAGLAWCGDLAVALEQLDVGKSGRSLADSAPALELVAWSISEDHIALRDKLGISLKGTRQP